MKKITVGTLLFVLVSAFGVQAQELSKEEKKEWKKKIKTLSPDKYKELIESQEDLQSQVTESNSKISVLQEESDSKDAEIAKLKTKLDDIQPVSTQAIASKGGVADAPARTARVIPGLVFKVQIGAFKGVDLQKYFGNSQNFGGEVDGDGTLKYTIGVFTEYWEADKFKKALREMGVKGAWIVSYKDGQRIPMEDALEGAVN